MRCRRPTVRSVSSSSFSPRVARSHWSTILINENSGETRPLPRATYPPSPSIYHPLPSATGTRLSGRRRGRERLCIQPMSSSRLQALWNHPAGPKTIHFWAPTFKWGISIANIADFSKPPEKLSYPQQIAVAATGIVWSRYSTVITPKNWNLFSVNVAMAGTGLYQLGRKIRHDYFSDAEPALAKE